MRVRTAAIAAALVIAAACKTSGSQKSGGTASSSEPSSTYGTTAETQRSPSGTTAGHGSDQVVSGAIARVSPDAVAIVSDLGDTVVLGIVPETSIMVNGQDATYQDLQEGQPVRASFSEVQGEGDVAVEIRVLPAPGGGSYGSSGSSGSSGYGTGSGDTGPSSGSGTRW